MLFFLLPGPHIPPPLPLPSPRPPQRMEMRTGADMWLVYGGIALTLLLLVALLRWKWGG